MTDDDLLKPSLGDGTKLQPIYSVGALIAAAFFGGGPAVVIVASLNSGRLARVGRDAALLVLGFVIAVAVPIAVLHGQLPDADTDSLRNTRLVNRGIGFVLAGAVFLLHRDAYRTMRTMGIEPPKPWVPVLAATLAGIAITLVSVTAYRSFVAAAVS
ncbi:MAG: hypothetical protein R3176_02975 [Woeseiaceae bacterium]|nr:hypothetical protein [Woeseiaceae bacterium]